MFIWNARNSSPTNLSVDGVLTRPGEIALTRIPSAAPSAASVFVSPITPPLAAACAACPSGAIPRTPDIEAVLMTDAPPARCRCRHAGRVV